ncbi:MAG: SDR family oxidoreductase [Deltaproteobacteria bacterium]|nr:SDR family oxidoreductase [Deltaproteobacteria bacterium]
MSLKGRVAMVTGGGRGIGKGISLALAEAGADVAIIYRRGEDEARQTAKEIDALGVRAAIYAADLTDYEAVKKAVDEAVGTFGKIDILVNNAGIASRGRSVLDTEVAEVRRVMETHTIGAFSITQAVLPVMRQQPRGDIIFISSVAAEILNPYGAPYNMAKAALEALAMTLAKEERPNNIRVNVIRSGLVETEMGVRLAKATMGIKDIQELYPVSPFGRVGLPSDAGKTVAFLCSKDAEYITCATIRVSGGM